MKINLNDNWTMYKAGTLQAYPCSVPCSVYQVLLEKEQIVDPFYRENEYAATLLCDDDYTFAKNFSLEQDQISASDKMYLTFRGIDTLSEIFLNDTKICETNNMHRTWQVEVKDILRAGENQLLIQLKSPNRYVAKKHAQRPLWGQDMTMPGYSHLRKVHCMFGWDWGPILPDLGIWQDVELTTCCGGRLLDVYYSQSHKENTVTLHCAANAEVFDFLDAERAVVKFVLFTPDGEEIACAAVPVKDGCATCALAIANPKLWWVRGLGEQPLYTCAATLEISSPMQTAKEDFVADFHSTRIGLRTLTISQEEDAFGKEFCFINNGVKLFAMGANYIPEDQILVRVTPNKTIRLLEDCKKANYNFLRVWGGGHYASEPFYNWCDENGIIVWQDFMFACSAYLLTDEFRETITAEFKDQILRLRNHASLGLWCGNNEVESAWVEWGIPKDDEAQRDYLTIFEEIIPACLDQYDPDHNTFYWPSSPSSGGGFQTPSSNAAGDMHYWDIWHGLKPIEAFRQHYYRFCSEYGFESVPEMKTCRAFAEEALGDFDLMSPVMETHQKCTQGTEKMMFYLAQMVRYPKTFEELSYASQLVQADCIRSSVEHMRRARGRCMGSAYWQVNDSNPVISWSSIDYFGRWKGLHYAAKKFYAPILLSVDDTDPLTPAFFISNETKEDFAGVVAWQLLDAAGHVLTEGKSAAQMKALSAGEVLRIDLSRYLTDREAKRTSILAYSLVKEDALTGSIYETIVSEGSLLFVRPKAFLFKEPQLLAQIKEDKDKSCFDITLTAKHYAKSVCLSLALADAVFEDNWVDVYPEKPRHIYLKKDSISAPLTAEELCAQLQAMCCNRSETNLKKEVSNG